MKRKPKYSNMDAAREVAMTLLDASKLKHDMSIKRRKGLLVKHDLAIALLPDEKPASTSHKPPQDVSQRKVVTSLGHRCHGFNHANFINR